jgi:hypothetical protein
MTFKYQVSGLNIVSDIEIPTLRSKEFKRADIEVRISSKVQTPNKIIEYLPDGKVLYKDVCENAFLISDSKIFLKVQDNYIDQASISLVGIPLGYVLQNNNFQVLHGSSVAISGSAVCFVGKSGAGKSSLAMALVDRGLKLVTEDLCIIKNMYIYNFSDWLKTNIDSLPAGVTYLSKMLIKKDSRNRVFYRLNREHVNNEDTALRAIYFLEESKSGVIKKLSSAESFKYLFTYAYRRNDVDVESFNKIAKISKDIPCFLFTRDLAKPLEENARLVFDHLDINFPEMFS